MAEDFKLVKYYSSRYILAHHIHPDFATKMVQGGATLLCLVHKPYEVKYSDISTNSTIVNLVINQLSYY